MMHRQEQSYGIIPLRKYRGKWQILLIQHGKGHWAFPKGHAEKNETPHQTAEREFNEETGLQIQTFLDLPPQEEHYFFRDGPTLIEKSVTYFVALVSGKILLQEAEISDYQWLSLEKAQELATYRATKALCTTVLELCNAGKI